MQFDVPGLFKRILKKLELGTFFMISLGYGFHEFGSPSHTAVLGIAAFCGMLLQTLVMALSALAQALLQVIFVDETSPTCAEISLTLCLCELLVSSNVVIAFTLLSITCFRRLLASVDSVVFMVFFLSQCIWSCLYNKWLS